MAAQDPSNLLPEVLPWLLLLLGFVIAGTVVLAGLRKLIRGGDDRAGEGFTLHDLRELHARGELSDGELDRAKRQLLAQLRSGKSGNAARAADGESRRSENTDRADDVERP